MVSFYPILNTSCHPLRTIRAVSGTFDSLVATKNNSLSASNLHSLAASNNNSLVASNNHSLVASNLKAIGYLISCLVWLLHATARCPG